MDLQTRIRDLIEDRDTTQKKVAKAVGITESTMSGYMTGKVRLPAWLIQMCAEYFQATHSGRWTSPPQSGTWCSIFAPSPGISGS